MSAKIVKKSVRRKENKIILFNRFFTLSLPHVLSTCKNRAMEERVTMMSDDEYRREELIRTVEHAVERLSLPELEALYYDMLTKDYIK